MGVPGDSFTPFALGRFNVVSPLGFGGLGDVYLGEDRHVMQPQPGRYVALKIFKLGAALDDAMTAALEDEARLQALLRHSNVMRVFALEKMGTQPYAVMEHLDGVDVGQLLAYLARAKKKLPVPLAVYVVWSVMRAVGHLRAAVNAQGKLWATAPRDISPRNVCVTQLGVVKLSDFGANSRADPMLLAALGLMRGRLSYLAPEVMQQQSHDARTDIYSAGVLLWEMLTGRRLFKGHKDEDLITQVLTQDVVAPLSLEPGVGAALSTLCLRALHRNPAHRFQTPAEFEMELQQCLAGTTPRNLSAALARLVKEYAPLRQPEDLEALPRPLEPTTLAQALAHNTDVLVAEGQAQGSWSMLDEVFETPLQAVEAKAGVLTVAMVERLREELASQPFEAPPELEEWRKEPLSGRGGQETREDEDGPWSTPPSQVPLFARLDAAGDDDALTPILSQHHRSSAVATPGQPPNAVTTPPPPAPGPGDAVVQDPYVDGEDVSWRSSKSMRPSGIITLVPEVDPLQPTPGAQDPRAQPPVLEPASAAAPSLDVPGLLEVGESASGDPPIINVGEPWVSQPEVWVPPLSGAAHPEVAPLPPRQAPPLALVENLLPDPASTPAHHLAIASASDLAALSKQPFVMEDARGTKHTCHAREVLSVLLDPLSPWEGVLSVGGHLAHTHTQMGTLLVVDHLAAFPRLMEVPRHHGTTHTSRMQHLLNAYEAQRATGAFSLRTKEGKGATLFIVEGMLHYVAMAGAAPQLLDALMDRVMLDLDSLGGLLRLMMSQDEGLYHGCHRVGIATESDVYQAFCGFLMARCDLLPLFGPCTFEFRPDVRLDYALPVPAIPVASVTHAA